MAWRSLPGRRGSRWLGRFSMLPKVLSGHPGTPDTSFSDAAQLDAGRGTVSHVLCLLLGQMRAGAQQAVPCVRCPVRCGEGRSEPCPVSTFPSDAGRGAASRALCPLPCQMRAGAQRAVPCVRCPVRCGEGSSELCPVCAALSDAGRGAVSRALCPLPCQMRAGAQRAVPCVRCPVRCGQGCSEPCPVCAALSDVGRGAASRALCPLPRQMRAGAQRAVPCVCRHLWGVQLRGRGSGLDALQHLSALGGGHLQRSGGASEHGNRVSSSEGLK